MSERLQTVVLGALVACGAAAYAGGSGRFEWTTKSKEAKALLTEVQSRVERFQFGADTVELARKLAKADPEFALGVYYLGVFEPDPKEAQAARDRSVALAPKASEGERRFLEAMAIVNANNGANFRDGIPPLEKLAVDYPNERLVQVILGQLYQGDSQAAKARGAFERAEALGPSSPRVRSFLANGDLLRGEYKKARATFASIEKGLPKGSAPFMIRYGVAFSHLYEADVDAALQSLETYLSEYRDSGASQGFPEVFIWNSVARINLESGRLDAAMKAYEKGYESVPGSNLPEDQKKVWYGRLRHGRARVLAKMGRTEEAWAESESIRKMIEEGGEAGKQYWPMYHYVAGYVKLESGDLKSAVEHLEQADPKDPFHRLLLARAYERQGDHEKAKQAYRAVVESTNSGLERALAYPEAKRKLGS